VAVALESDRNCQRSAVGTIIVNVQPDDEAVVDRVDLTRDGTTSRDRVFGRWTRVLSMAMNKLQSFNRLTAARRPKYLARVAVMSERFARLHISRICPMRHGENIADTNILIRRTKAE